MLEVHITLVKQDDFAALNPGAQLVCPMPSPVIIRGELTKTTSEELLSCCRNDFRSVASSSQTRSLVASREPAPSNVGVPKVGANVLERVRISVSIFTGLILPHTASFKCQTQAQPGVVGIHLANNEIGDGTW
jgi:hypothetical protein